MLKFKRTLSVKNHGGKETAYGLLNDWHLYKFCLDTLNIGFLTGMRGSMRAVVSAF